MMIPDVLGNLRDLVSGKRDKPVAGQGSVSADINRDGGVIPSKQVADWLEELGDLTEAEDLEGVLAKIQVLKSQIESEGSD